MALPGFNAELSLYRSAVLYRLKGSAVQAGGIMTQSFSCSRCYWDASTGRCLRSCTSCPEGVEPDGCSTTIGYCPASECPSCGPCFCFRYRFGQFCWKDCAGQIIPC